MTCTWCGDPGLDGHVLCQSARIRAFAKASFLEAERMQAKGELGLSDFYSGKGMGLLQAAEMLEAAL